MSLIQKYEISSIQSEKEWLQLVKFSLNLFIVQGQTQFFKIAGTFIHTLFEIDFANSIWRIDIV